MTATAVRSTAERVPIEHESTDRVVRTLVFAVPPGAVVAAGWLAWGGTLHWHDLVVLAITYTLTGLGVTVGYHRRLCARSFSRPGSDALGRSQAGIERGRREPDGRRDAAGPLRCPGAMTPQGPQDRGPQAESPGRVWCGVGLSGPRSTVLPDLWSR